MIKGAKQSKGYYSATCNYYKNFWKYEKPFILHEYLANFCKKCLNSIIMYYAELVRKELRNKIIKEKENLNSDTENPLIKKVKQTAVSNFFEPKKLEKGRINKIDCVITKAFVMCNIPFNIIKNLWFLDLIKTLQPAYDASSRQVLSGSLLQAELARVNMRIHNELLNESGFTIGKNFIIVNYN